MKKSLYLNAVDSLRDLVKNPLLITMMLVYYAVSFGLSYISTNISSTLNTNFSLIAWISFYVLLQFVLISALALALAIKSFKIINKNHSLRLSKIKLLRFFLLMIISLLSMMLVNFVSRIVAGYIGNFFLFSVNSALAVYILVYLAFTLGFIIFLTFPAFISLLYDKSILSSLRVGFKLTISNYLSLILLGLSVFLVNFILSSFFGNDPLVIDILNYVIFFPWLFLILMRLLYYDLPAKR